MENINTVKTLLSRQELAERWGVSVRHIITLESDGTIHRVNVGAVRYSINEILQIEKNNILNEKGFNYDKVYKENVRLKDRVEELERCLKTIRGAVGGI